MPFLTFLFEAVLISLSGIMAPGPITAITICKGNESPHAGALIAVGHGIIEFPLMVFIFYGFGYLQNSFYIKPTIGFIGGLILFVMGIGMLRSIKNVDANSSRHTHSSIIAGVVLSAGNPYFLIWWATVGAALILRSISFGILGFLIFAVVHWSCDFLWYYFLSALSFKGKKFFGNKFQKIIFMICGIFLLILSGKFIFEAVVGFRAIIQP
ncbi:hypothetical protein DRQ00_04315 [candidate division KSB1 bacterium]|nr:MAG: hypothetical protein DRQ00_04315 [candidate division KSB1 bacterium]RKY87634.1 MAG: hypothetical protein DRQ11_05745 [candidate division KSB1 bacterium]